MNNQNENKSSDRGIPNVGGDDRSEVLIGGVLILAAIFLVVFIYLRFFSAPEAVESLPAQVEDEYNRERIKQAPEIKIEEAIVTAPPEPPKAEPRHNLYQRDLEREKERRRKSPLVIYDQLKPNLLEPQSEDPEQQQMLEKIIADNLQAHNNDPDSLDGRLKGSSVEMVEASVLNDKSYLIAQGKMIGAIIETAISSDLPGMVRAILNESVYSEDGKNILLSKGSRIVGEYRSGIVSGHARIFVIWNRVITPKGIDIMIQSPGTDTLGRSGHSGWIDSHFGERFGASILLSSIGAAAAQDNDSAFNEQVGENFNASAEIALRNSINIRPTLHKNQGESIKIFVAKDLNFKKALELAGR